METKRDARSGAHCLQCLPSQLRETSVVVVFVLVVQWSGIDSRISETPRFGNGIVCVGDDWRYVIDAVLIDPNVNFICESRLLIVVHQGGAPFEFDTIRLRSQQSDRK